MLHCRRVVRAGIERSLNLLDLVCGLRHANELMPSTGSRKRCALLLTEYALAKFTSFLELSSSAHLPRSSTATSLTTAPSRHRSSGARRGIGPVSNPVARDCCGRGRATHITTRCADITPRDVPPARAPYFQSRLRRRLSRGPPGQDPADRRSAGRPLSSTREKCIARKD